MIPGSSSVGQLMSVLLKDKFLVTAMSLPPDVDVTAVSNSQLTEILKVRISLKLALAG